MNEIMKRSIETDRSLAVVSKERVDNAAQANLRHKET
jgi:hypothetical protein